MTGLLVAFEGGDKAGKSTNVEELAKYLTLKGHDVITIDFPCYETPSGQAIEAILSETHTLHRQHNPHEVQALYAINRYEQQATIINALMEGKVVIVDRYMYSSVVYGALDGVDVNWTQSIQTSMVQPDITLLLDLGIEEYKRRCEGVQLDTYEKDFAAIESAQDLYRHFAKENNWIIINGAQSKEAVSRDIQAAVQSHLDMEE